MAFFIDITILIAEFHHGQSVLLKITQAVKLWIDHINAILVDTAPFFPAFYLCKSILLKVVHIVKLRINHPLPGFIDKTIFFAKVCDQQSIVK